jgi:CubicO group peptidase (beta-lactamase class C family)
MGDRRGANAKNWLDAPYNRWGFLHVGELAHTESISRGSESIAPLPSRERDLDAFHFDHEGQGITFRQMLDATYTDAILVLQDGEVLFEHYVDGMAPSDTHLLMSASKSLTSILCGVLVGKGFLRPDDEVVEHVHELRGSSWQGCTVQHLLDMRSGTRWDYDVDEYTILDVSDYRAHDRGELLPDTQSWIRSIENSHQHGGPFRYISLATDVLGWVLASAGGAGFASLFSRHVWSAIGAEYDAEIVVDRSGFPVVEGGICTTLRDFTRFGQMCLLDGRVGDHQVVPREWLGRLRTRDQELIDTFAESSEVDSSKPDAFYHDNWWITDAERGVYSALGMNGQQLMIHRPSRVVVAKFSTHPIAEDHRLFALQDAGLAALCEWIAG